MQFLCTSKDGANRRWLAPDGCTLLEERKYTHTPLMLSVSGDETMVC